MWKPVARTFFETAFFLLFFRRQDRFFSMVLGTPDQHIFIPQMAEISGPPLMNTALSDRVNSLPSGDEEITNQPISSSRSTATTAACEDQQINKPTAEIRTKTFHKYNVLNKMALFIHKVVCNHEYAVQFFILHLKGGKKHE